MKLKRIIPICLCLVMLFGCTTSSTNSKKKKTTNEKETVQKEKSIKLTKVKGEMVSSSEMFWENHIAGSTIEYEVDDEGLVHTFTFSWANCAPAEDSETGDPISDDEISKWKKNMARVWNQKYNGFSVTNKIGDKMTQDESHYFDATKTVYKWIIIYKYDYSKLDSEGYNAFKECDLLLNDDLVIKNKMLTEDSLKQYLEKYFSMEFTVC